MENVLLLNSVLAEYIEAKRATAKARDIRVLEDALEIISEDVAREERKIADEVKIASWKEPNDG